MLTSWPFDKLCSSYAKDEFWVIYFQHHNAFISEHNLKKNAFFQCLQWDWKLIWVVKYVYIDNLYSTLLIMTYSDISEASTQRKCAQPIFSATVFWFSQSTFYKHYNNWEFGTKMILFLKIPSPECSKKYAPSMKYFRSHFEYLVYT